MPEQERDEMTSALAHEDGIDILYTTLLKTNIEEAKASVEMDRVQILKLIEAGPGFHALNTVVNKLLRKWVNDGILDMVERR